MNTVIRNPITMAAVNLVIITTTIMIVVIIVIFNKLTRRSDKD